MLRIQRMFRRIPVSISTAAIIAMVASRAVAHDFWIEPPQGWGADEATAVEIRFYVGHAGARAPWRVNMARIHELALINEGQRMDISDAIRTDANGLLESAIAAPTAAGTHVMLLRSSPATIVLDADKFNAYIHEEGLIPAIEQRRAANMESSPGRESYSRVGKIIFERGDAPDETAASPVGARLEIVPDTNPRLLQPGSPLTVRVLYQGAPLAGAKVTIESLTSGLIPPADALTDSVGRAGFSIPHRGAWKLTTVWTKPATVQSFDFDTTFSSLTFSF